MAEPNETDEQAAARLRAYVDEIIEALDCHPAHVLDEIARLREVAAEAVTLDDVRQREQRARAEGEHIGALAVWSSVDSLIRSGTPVDGLAEIARQNIAGLKALTEDGGVA